jgi:hypothetical protein
MTRHIQKIDEVALVELLRRALGGDPPGQIEPQEDEEEGQPDSSSSARDESGSK